MFHVILYQPEIPPNTGNVIRLCANTGARLHLIEPLGFALEDRLLRRAGLDYHEWASVQVHAGLTDCLTQIRGRVHALTTRATRSVYHAKFALEDALLFGPETRGLPTAVLDTLPDEQRLRLPMRAESRSLNLSNAVAVTVYEAWRQLAFPGAAS
ncbi:tRNA (cytidine/uridine-2'-O-)-methyltransferase [Natronocella acetinitrilica]|jgi:tRNA (cytidine/uridine-2'-O-)-methyltransferase|uniref:tRNA (cytidine(34)-2'-O)-methyltransferase n=1 Tax=Natronocella acetinitrilica TaxID=414046 RepID=A0AAE3KER0_9GAMM|nr:tRNA (cytidine(34)-2'-O)-methyltransferase [Natronocella acetinitrilica]MCP1673357.1 tRNA (cytidine/uridine-2'-O-)-methyltransferase [Natronocella acetinitrilica]